MKCPKQCITVKSSWTLSKISSMFLTVQFRVGPDESAECEGLKVSVLLSDGSTHDVVMAF